MLANQSVTQYSLYGVASVKEAGVAGNEDSVREAAEACPVSAIEVA